jgi:hypothetical protein
MMVTPVENQLDEVYSLVESNYRNDKYVMTVNINQSDQKRVSAVSVSAITRKGDPNQHCIVDTGVVLDTGAALTITPTDDNNRYQTYLEQILYLNQDMFVNVNNY